MIENLNSRFRLDVVRAASTELEIEKLKKFSPIKIPDFYLGIVRQGSSFEILVDNRMYIRIWGAAGCLDMNSGYKIQEYLGPCLAIGDDEGGQALILMPDSPGFSAGLYLSDFGVLALKYSRYIAESLEDLLINGNGADRIYE